MNRNPQTFSAVAFIIQAFFLFLERLRATFFLKKIPQKTVTVFGSAQVNCPQEIYQQAYDIGRIAAENNWAVLTGGGPGVMASANKGCYNNGGQSFGCTIVIPSEQTSNDHIHKSFKAHSFCTRKDLLIRQTKLFVVLPGGFGTLDEVFEVLNLMRTKKIPAKKVVLFGKKFWQPLLQFLSQTVLSYKMYHPKDLDLVVSIDTLEEFQELLQNHE